jgi:O-antigen/teichoic acid export membrane protein
MIEKNTGQDEETHQTFGSNKRISRFDFAKDNLTNNLTISESADTKACLLLGIIGVLFGILVTNTTNLPWSYPYYIPFLLGLLFLLLSSMSCFAVIFSRIKRGLRPPSVIFFVSIVERKREEYLRQVKGISDEAILDDYLNNIYTLAKIQVKKYRWYRSSIILFLLAIVMFCVYSILNLNVFWG